MVTHYPSAPISCTEVPPNAGQVSQVTAADSRYAYSDSAIHVLKNVHIKEETFYATTLIIPKQKSTSSSCQALREEEIFNIQNDRSLFPVGWIHTHPSQSCFMSSIDLHTQYPYQLAVAMQVMVPEAIAIVVAPTDKTRNYGIFRLTDPSGMNVVKECEENGFHPHRDSTDGRPLYEQCSHVYINPNLRFEIFDLR
ncbi:AMSH-like ubiquitin thioesterase 2 isoform X4 [Beta vulgaris subsp. vulgaris]|uniref:AMSH-like ubiquitin thioesterase 2 isoform X4 n=1 Tax=Beta vulgaris subsp. vulgaris TaxID=3555 RepID=UPI0009017B2A|nr:AMSH-like ubiquitin thioesterase 2 isoform X4 [Beta vulgaris subsp. vulgaris]